MKKILFALIILLTIFINVKAYENENFKITLPENYKEKSIEKKLFQWINKDNDGKENIVITVDNNSLSKYNIANFSDKDIVNYKEYLEEGINKELKDYNIIVTVSNVKKEKLNNYDVLSYDMLWPTKESYGYDMHQKGYAFTTKKYIITYTFTSDKKITKENKDFNSTINSLEILDEKVNDQSFFSNRWNRILIVGSVAGLIGYIISALSKKKKQNTTY